MAAMERTDPASERAPPLDPVIAKFVRGVCTMFGVHRGCAHKVCRRANACATANAVCPGNTLTGMVRRVASVIGARDGLTGEAWLAMRAGDCPMGRIAQPWEIAGVVAFLASEDSRYLTGQALEVDGGMVMA